MAETPRAGTGDIACRSWRYRCSIVLMRQGNLFMSNIFLIRCVPPLVIVDNSPNMHNTGFFPDCHLFSLTDGSIWILYLARYSKIFKKPNCQVVKWKSTFIWKILSRRNWKTEGSRLATIFGLPPTPHTNRIWRNASTAAHRTRLYLPHTRHMPLSDSLSLNLFLRLSLYLSLSLSLSLFLSLSLARALSLSHMCIRM